MLRLRRPAGRTGAWQRRSRTKSRRAGANRWRAVVSSATRGGPSSRARRAAADGVVRAMVTGHNGFIGRHLSAHLDGRGIAVSGYDRATRGDVRDVGAVHGALVSDRPDVVFHLAATMRAAEPVELYSVNVLGTVALLEAVSRTDARPTVVIVSSSAVYGPSGAEPVPEGAIPQPRSHYGASKLAGEMAALRYARAEGVRVVVARVFNVLGPDLPTTFACGSFAAQIARLEDMEDPVPVRTGTLSTWRDYVDVRDVARAILALGTHGQSGEIYNVCSGRALMTGDCLRILLKKAARRLQTIEEHGRSMVDEVERQTGDPTKLHDATGWRPEIAAEASLADMLEYRRNELK